MTNDRAAVNRPLPILLSHVLGALTAELEGDDTTHPLAMYSNVLRCVANGADEKTLPAAARISSRLATAFVTRAARVGLITAEPEGGKNRKLELTDAGRDAVRMWSERLAKLDGPHRDTPLRDALERLVGQFRLDLPHFPASYGSADPSAIGGPYMQGQKRKDDLPAHGNDWKPVFRGEADTPSSLSIVALLSQALMAFTIDYEDGFPWPLENTANVLCHITEEPQPLADLPEDHGITGKGKSLLERHLMVTLTPDPNDKRQKLVALSDRGKLVMQHHPKRLDVVEQEWTKRYGEALINGLRKALGAAAPKETYPDHVTAPLY